HVPQADVCVTWESLDWLRSLTSLPIVLKGILIAEDAMLAVEHGVDGIIVSNHGGRQLDSVPASIEALSEIVEAVAGHCEGFLDDDLSCSADYCSYWGTLARAFAEPCVRPSD